MLLKKIKNYAQDRGLKALAVKIKERVEYKRDTDRYMKSYPLSGSEIQRQRSHMFDKMTLISICVPVYNTDKNQLVQMLESVINQTYGYWELCIADGSTDEFSYVGDIIKSYDDERIIYKKLDQNKGIVANSNEACEMAKGEYIALLDHDDVLAPDALFMIKVEIDNNADYIYTDEASFSGSIDDPSIIHFKPDYSVFDLRGNNYICHLSVFKRSLFQEVGGFRTGFDGSQDHDLILRICEIAQKIVHIPRVLYFWRIHPKSVAMDISAKPYCITSGIKAVEDHLKRQNINASVSAAVKNASVYRVDYDVNIETAVLDSFDKFKGCECEYMIFADKNISPDDNAVNQLAQYIQLDNVGAVCGMIVSNDKIRYTAIKKYKNILRYEYKNTPLISDGYMKRLKYAHSVDVVNPYFFAIKKSIFEEVCKRDKNMKYAFDTVDFCKEIKAMGYEVVFNPYAVAYANKKFK